MEEELEERSSLEAFAELGFSLDDASLLFENGIPTSFAADWHHDFPSDPAEEIIQFFSLDPDQAPAWRSALFTPTEAHDWHACHSSPEEASAFIAAGIRAADYQEWNNFFPEDSLMDFISEVRSVRPDLTTFSDCLALRVVVGEDPEGVSDWLASGFSPKEIARLSEAGLSGFMARYWRSELPDCTPETILSFRRIESLGSDDAVRWIKGFPDRSPEDLAFLAARLGPLYLLEQLVLMYDPQSPDLDLDRIRSVLDQVSDHIMDASALEASSGPRTHNQAMLCWGLSFPDLSPQEVRDFARQSSASTFDALDWHLAFPDDSPSQISRYLGLDVPPEFLKMMRREFPDLDPEQVLTLYNSLRGLFSVEGEWGACILWKAEFPDWSDEEIVELCTSLPFEGINGAFSWVRYKEGITPPMIMQITEQITGVSPPEQSDLRFVTYWITDYPDDSPELIKAWVDAFDDRDTAAEWRASGLDPEEAFSFYESLFYREPEIAEEYKRLGVDAVTAGEWDCVFRDTPFDCHGGLEDWQQVFPEMTVNRVYDAAQWFHYGFDSPSEVAGWVREEVDIFDALLFVACGCREPEMARAWLDRGFSGAEAARLLGEEWVLPEALEEQSGVSLSLDNASLISAFSSFDFLTSEAAQWIRSGVVDPQVAREWQDSGFGPVSSALWISAGCPSPRAALEWWEAGATPLRAGQLLSERGLSFSEATPATFKSSFDWQTRDQFAPGERLT